MKLENAGGLNVRLNYDREALISTVEKAHAGNTIIFFGAGFTQGSENVKNQVVPLARQLSQAICNLGGFEEDEDLAYAADYYLKYFDPVRLIGLLKDCFCIKSIAEHHVSIARINWRRVYTTNYDDCFEFASGICGKVVSPLTLESNPTKYFRARNFCVHINGAIQTLDVTALEKAFKLSESSYTNSDAFSNSSWAYRFKKDLELCSQIIFVGYSLYDMEVKRLLVGPRCQDSCRVI